MSDIITPFSNKESLSSQVYHYLKDLLIKGHFKPGYKFPSENDLSRSLNVSRLSLREALQRLEIEGYIERKRGIGTFVIDRHPQHVEAGIEKLISMSEVIRSRGHQPGTADIHVFADMASEDIANKLNLNPGDPITYINRIRTIDDKPNFYDSNCFPSRYFPATIPAESIGESLFKYTEQKLGLFISHAVARLLPAKADQFLAQKLLVPEGSLLINLEQVHYLTDNMPIWYSLLSYPEANFSWYIVRTR